MAKKEEEEKKSLGRRFKDAVKKELGIPDLTGKPRGGLYIGQKDPRLEAIGIDTGIATYREVPVSGEDIKRQMEQKVSQMNRDASVMQAINRSAAPEANLKPMNVPEIKTPNIQAAAEAGAADTRFNSGTPLRTGGLDFDLADLDYPGVAEASSPEIARAMAGAYLDGTVLDPRTAASPQERGLVEIEGSAGGAFAKPEDIEAAKQRELARFGTEEQRLKEFGTLDYTPEEMQQIRRATAGTLSRFGRGLQAPVDQPAVSLGKTLQGLQAAADITEQTAKFDFDARRKQGVANELLSGLYESGVIDENGAIIDSSLTDEDVRKIRRAARQGFQLAGQIGKQDQKEKYSKDLDQLFTNIEIQRGTPARQRKMTEAAQLRARDNIFSGEYTNDDLQLFENYVKAQDTINKLGDKKGATAEISARFAAEYEIFNTQREDIQDRLKAIEAGEIKADEQEIRRLTATLRVLDEEAAVMIQGYTDEFNDLDLPGKQIKILGQLLTGAPAPSGLADPSTPETFDSEEEKTAGSATGNFNRGAGRGLPAEDVDAEAEKEEEEEETVKYTPLSSSEMKSFNKTIAEINKKSFGKSGMDRQYRYLGKFNQALATSGSIASLIKFGLVEEFGIEGESNLNNQSKIIIEDLIVDLKEKSKKQKGRRRTDSQQQAFVQLQQYEKELAFLNEQIEKEEKDNQGL